MGLTWRVQVQVQVLLFTLIQLQYNNKEKKGRSKKQSELYIELNIKKEECVAAKGAKLSSWLLPQSNYKWVEVIRY